MSARSFLWRWNVRLLRLEWRQHVVIFGLITVGVALSVGGVLAAYNLVEPPESEFGAGRFAVSSNVDPAALEAALISQGYDYAAIESATVLVGGTTQRVALRAVDPANRVASPLVSLLDGRYPATPTEVAISDRAIVDAAVGQPLTLAGGTVTVVGVVENPTKLSDEFVLAAPDVALPGIETDVRFLVDTDPNSARFPGVSDFGVTSTGGPPVRTVLTLAVNTVAALGMLEVALLVGAGFAVVARRRSRQYGLLAAAGASPSAVRMATTQAGIIVGAAGATVGLALGLVAAWSLVPGLESAVDHRISFAVPWWTVVPNVALAIVIAALAARWPTRGLSKRPVAHLLTAMRPQPARSGRPALVGLVLTGAGAAALAIGFARLNTLLALLGVIVAPIGLLAMSPLLVQAVGWFSARLPLAPRLAGRSISRHNRRAAAVVAALALALAIPAGMAVVTSSLDERSQDRGPNVADTQFILWQPGVDDRASRIPAQLDADRMTQAVERLAAAAPDLTLVPIDTAIERGGPREVWDFDRIGSQASVAPLLSGRPGGADCLSCDSYGFGDTDDDGGEITWIAEDTWLASPALLEVLSIDSDWLDDGAVAVAKSAEYRALSVGGVIDPGRPVAVAPDWPNNARIPDLLVAPAAVDVDAYERVGIGWFAAAVEPISAETRDLVRDAVGPDLVIEFHSPPQTQSGLRAVAVAIALILGLGIAGSAVSLFTTELADDLRVLTSIGAGPRTGRGLRSAVAALLALPGAVMGAVIGYLPLLPLLAAKEANFPFVVPWLSLFAIVVGFPVLAAGIGWITRSGPSSARLVR